MQQTKSISVLSWSLVISILKIVKVHVMYANPKHAETQEQSQICSSLSFIVWHNNPEVKVFNFDYMYVQYMYYTTS